MAHKRPRLTSDRVELRTETVTPETGNPTKYTKAGRQTHRRALQYAPESCALKYSEGSFRDLNIVQFTNLAQTNGLEILRDFNKTDNLEYVKNDHNEPLGLDFWPKYYAELEKKNPELALRYLAEITYLKCKDRFAPFISYLIRLHKGRKLPHYSPPQPTKTTTSSHEETDDTQPDTERSANPPPSDMFMPLEPGLECTSVLPVAEPDVAIEQVGQTDAIGELADEAKEQYTDIFEIFSRLSLVKRTELLKTDANFGQRLLVKWAEYTCEDTTRKHILDLTQNMTADYISHLVLQTEDGFKRNLLRYWIIQRVAAETAGHAQKKIQDMKLESITDILRGIGVPKTRIMELWIELCFMWEESDTWKVETALGLPHTVCMGSSVEFNPFGKNDGEITIKASLDDVLKFVNNNQLPIHWTAPRSQGTDAADV